MKSDVLKIDTKINYVAKGLNQYKFSIMVKQLQCYLEHLEKLFDTSNFHIWVIYNIYTLIVH